MSRYTWLAVLGERKHSRRRFLVSDSRPPEFAAPVAGALDAELVTMGSAGVGVPSSVRVQEAGSATAVPRPAAKRAGRSMTRTSG